MTLPRPRFTYAEYTKLPDDQRYEVLEGELVMTPAPNWKHSQISLALMLQMAPYIMERNLGNIAYAPVDVILSEHNVVQPDLLFIRAERASIVKERGVFGAPDLAVEILSPSNEERDLQTKRRLYSEYGVREYWIIDPAAKSVEVLTQQGAGLDTWQRFQGAATLQSPLLTGLEISLAKLFPST